MCHEQNALLMSCLLSAAAGAPLKERLAAGAAVTAAGAACTLWQHLPPHLALGALLAALLANAVYETALSWQVRVERGQGFSPQCRAAACSARTSTPQFLLALLASSCKFAAQHAAAGAGPCALAAAQLAHPHPPALSSPVARCL